MRRAAGPFVLLIGIFGMICAICALAGVVELKSSRHPIYLVGASLMMLSAGWSWMHGEVAG